MTNFVANFRLRRPGRNLLFAFRKVTADTTTIITAVVTTTITAAAATTTTTAAVDLTTTMAMTTTTGATTDRKRLESQPTKRTKDQTRKPCLDGLVKAWATVWPTWSAPSKLGDNRHLPKWTTWKLIKRCHSRLTPIHFKLSILISSFYLFISLI